MKSFKTKLLLSTVMPLVVVVGVGVVTAAATTDVVVNTAVAGKKGCNPCAAKNPCAANSCNPCNPCAAGGQAFSSQCVVPRLQLAAKCNPCAAKGCNPCAAKGCNPCAAKACNPCAANPCNPCNPCAAGGGVELTSAEAAKVYDCMINEMQAAYAKSGGPVSNSYQSWKRYSKVAYVSGTHGGRYVQNYGNAKAKAYGKYEDAGRMPVGAILAKDSFQVTGAGKVSVGPLFVMEKMPGGWNKASDDWKYSLVLPTGAIMGVTKGTNSKAMKFCYECHISVAEDQDSLLFLPEENRTN